MAGPLTQAILLIINVLFGAYIFVIMLRILMMATGVNFHNPLAQFAHKVTEPVCAPLKKVLPRVRAFDMPGVVLLFLVDVIKLTLIATFTTGLPFLPGLILLAIPDLLSSFVNLIFFAVLIVVILSWIQPQGHNPALEVLYKITDPLMRRAQKLIPPVAGFDLSPILIILGIKLVEILVIGPLFVAIARFVGGL